MIKRERLFVLILFIFFLSFFVCVNGRHFVLIHGASHGAWCWYKVATLLKSAGHNVTALDMAASGINPKQVQEIRTVSDYVEPLMAFMESLPPEEKVVLMGHSQGGMSISVAMERFPEKISVAVFVSAVVLSENFTFSDINQEDLTLALSLVRPVPLFNDIELLLKETKVTKARNGRVPEVFIVSKRDKVETEDIEKWMIKKAGPFAEVKVIQGSDHMVMFSRPKKLSSCLLQIAHKF